MCNISTVNYYGTPGEVIPGAEASSPAPGPALLEIFIFPASH